MKIVGLITEYNPFHNGHLYHMQKAKEITGADSVIAVMSGNYVQRGAPAIMPKHLRAEVSKIRSSVSSSRILLFSSLINVSPFPSYCQPSLSIV